MENTEKFIWNSTQNPGSEDLLSFEVYLNTQLSYIAEEGLKDQLTLVSSEWPWRDLNLNDSFA